MTKKLKPIHPGEILLEEFLEPMDITPYRLAKSIHVPQARIGEILAGKRAVSADTDLRLTRFFGLSEGFFARLQVDYDVRVAKAELGRELESIEPWTKAA